MNDEMKRGPEKRRWFPSIAGIFAGLIPGVAALFNEFSSPFWIAFNITLIVVALGFAAANLIGLAVVRYHRRTSGRSSPE
ncbi:hypothetical protein AB0N24_23360 [Arthrobacter sp. NPDC093128]|uniref:hypothetical protein n=1 Tax=Arthrobacter sp. NPDC093128 TaxID=3154979 RepID=UPI00344A0AD6